MPSGIEGDSKDIIEFSQKLKNVAITVEILKYINGTKKKIPIILPKNL